LLIHFCSRRNTVNSEVNELLRVYQANDFVGVLVNVLKYLKLGGWLRVSIDGVCAWVDDAIHVQVQVVDLRVLSGYFVS
jgi:hypothetical protein